MKLFILGLVCGWLLCANAQACGIDLPEPEEINIEVNAI